jgi:hypothetical protein
MSETKPTVVSPRQPSTAPTDRPAHADANPGDPAGSERRPSVWDVLHGLEVRDFTETLPSDVWEQLFPGRDKRD